MKKKDFDERVCELKEKYVGVNDFDFETIVMLEDEYYSLLENNPEHTKRRREVLDMRYRLLSNLRPKRNE